MKTARRTARAALPAAARRPAPAARGLDGQGLPAGLRARLARARIDSWAELRREPDAAALARRAGTTTAEARRLLRHAHLALVARDPAVRDRLVASGLTSVSMVARMPAGRLRRKLAGLQRDEVKRLQVKAQWVTNALMAQVAHKATASAMKQAGYRDPSWLGRGYGTGPRGGKRKDDVTLHGRWDFGAWLDDLIPDDAAPEPCVACAGCNSAVSPGAYLLELLDFVQDAFIRNGRPLTLSRLEPRFLQRWEQLPLDCGAVEEAHRQVKLVIGVLERFILRYKPAWGRAGIYQRMASLAVMGEPAATPDVLVQMYDAYLTELGTSRGEVAAAVAAGGQAIADLAGRVHLSVPQVTALARPDAAILQQVALVDGLPALVTAARGDQAPAALDRVEEHYLAAVRDNLVRLALDAVPATVLPGRTPAGLGRLLCVDLTGGACARTTRVALAILTLQAFLQAVRLGRETTFLAGYETYWNESRWRWLQSYGTWHAAQMIYLYPENYLLQGTRHSQTSAFAELLAALRARAPLSPLAIQQAVEAYGADVASRLQVGSYGRRQVVAVNQRVILVMSSTGYGTALEDDHVDIAMFDRDGQWLGWERVMGVPGHKLVGAVEFQQRLYLFFVTDEDSETTVHFTWVDPSREPLSELRNRLTEFQATLHLFDYFVTDTIVVAGSRHVNLYFDWQPITQTELRQSTITLDVNHNHVWAAGNLTVERRAPGADPAIAYASLLPLAHYRGRDYLYAIRPAGTWIIEVDHPDAALTPGSSPLVISRTWAIEQSGGGFAAMRGAAVSNGLVLFHSKPPQQQLCLFDPAVGTLSWVALPAMSASPMNGPLPVVDGYVMTCLSSTGAQGGATYVSYTFDGQRATEVSRGSLLLPPDTWNAVRALVPAPRSGEALGVYRQRQAELYDAVAPQGFGRLLLDEWFLFVPLAVAHELGYQGAFQEAADWYHLLFHPFEADEHDRLTHAGFARGADAGGASYRDSRAWLEDPFQPHALARLRGGTYLRHVLLAYIENLLDWADQLFARDSAESIAQARQRYELALELLGFDELAADACRRQLRSLTYAILTRYDLEAARSIEREAEAAIELGFPDEVRRALARLERLVNQALPPRQFASRARRLLAALPRSRRRSPVRTVASVRKDRARRWDRIAEEERSIWQETVLTGDVATGVLEERIEWQWVPQIATYQFCIPPNPALEALRLRATVNLLKIRHCRNIAGLEREVPVHGEPLDPAGLMAGGGAGELPDVVPASPPPVYRYTYLLERARYFVSLAQQLDSKLLSAIEKEEAEAYSLLQAQQHKSATMQHVKLQELRAKEADTSVSIAGLQRERVQLQHDYFDGLISAGISQYELASYFLMAEATAMHGLAALANFVGMEANAFMLQAGAAASSAAGFYSSLAAGFSSASQVASMLASWERRAQEWAFQRDLAAKDVRIAAQQIRLAAIGKDIADREVDIAGLNARFADDVVHFLSNKFTNQELYRWMAGTIRRIYREHLRFALVIARMAQSALAFERQEAVSIVGTQYWDAERRGLLAADQLLLDINRLDQHRFSTRQRKRELTKHISLASADPAAFQHLCQHGVMEFATLQSWFDRDFPGHYMRMIKSVSLTVVALVPPGEGLHATLRNSGVSKIMVGAPFTEPRTIVRQPEAVSVTAASNGTGLFQVDFNDELLLPFEQLGVETSWTLELPKGANAFDRSTLMDVVMTIQYTALEDGAYRGEVLRQMGTERVDAATGRRWIDAAVGGQAFVSLHHRFPDPWYHFHNPVFLPPPAAYGYGAGATWPPYGMRLQVRKSLFRPNEDAHVLSAITILAAGTPPGKVPLELIITPEGSAQSYTLHGDLDQGRWKIPAGTLTTGGAAVPLTTMAPYGEWIVRVRTDATGSAYAAAFAGATTVHGQPKINLGWLRDLMIVMEYRATTQYPL